MAQSKYEMDSKTDIKIPDEETPGTSDGTVPESLKKISKTNEVKDGEEVLEINDEETDNNQEKVTLENEKLIIIECIFKQFIFNAIILIAEHVDKHFLLKSESPVAKVFDLINTFSNSLKNSYRVWFSSMMEQSLKDLKESYRLLVESDFEKIKKFENKESLTMIVKITEHIIKHGLYKEILKLYTLDPDVVMDCEWVYSISKKSQEKTTSEIIPGKSKKMEKSVPTPSKIKPFNLQPCLKRIILNDAPSSPVKRIKKLTYIKGFLAFKYNPNPLAGVINYTLITFKEYVVNEVCDGNWLEKLQHHLTAMNVTHLHVQGRFQARYLREKIPNIFIVTLPERNKEKICEDCKTFSCSIGKVKNYLKEYHLFIPPISCKGL